MTHPYRYLLTGDVPVSLIDELCRWHDRMVAHARRVGAAPGAPCCADPDDCPRAEAGPLWARAIQALGPRAAGLTFLRQQAEEARRA
ncbi:hypothetical protein TBR22_A15100 [Luteitalea sp. TBR-22]|uniref:hypothetical protein n=1 Tax=Luteitalea sp. TBR-22 TaxID=2802971 RepID=UPI001AF111D2|nr:hypothetical protein [Luteitalea sp. TBR-22]BCS32300.1 hypothetical protein TBR22_A15100 [Luteitalea sp. TBR-22]